MGEETAVAIRAAIGGEAGNDALRSPANGAPGHLDTQMIIDKYRPTDMLYSWYSHDLKVLSEAHFACI